MSRIVIALLLWLVAIATAHAQWRQLPGQPPSASLAELASSLDLDQVRLVAAWVRTHRL